MDCYGNSKSLVIFALIKLLFKFCARMKRNKATRSFLNRYLSIEKILQLAYL
ncbi:MAG: hypothetical protein EZS26_002536 [Candidatus Ordinivivax streblomastigis]|uniref:Uncharacterized protein n=1 Tax=Candidatus Ordinivivax streblomastigis TaxID=2540710 RepID=A0A5M8NYW4_9BACT|nr:MAG: hypothetical protein EZS26_002536 [Candidatus Ordinivivax streblomastigis]